MAMRFGLSVKTLMAGIAGAAIMGTALVVPQYASRADARQIVVEAPEGAPLSFADLIERVSPAVVSVNVVSERERTTLADMERFLEQFRGLPGFEDWMERRRDEEEGEDGEPRTEEARSLGSGFFISADGYIVTNNHVIENATEIEIVMDDGREYEARLVGADPQTDLAVLKVDSNGDFPFVEFATEMELRRGDWVVALGNPFGLGGTATAGIVSAIGRRNELGRSSTYTDFFQIDAPINRGNSGGPTFDLYGHVVGVNTAIFSPTGGSVGIGFAIPSDLADSITRTLIEDGRVSRGWLGVTIGDLTDDMAEALDLARAEGAIVTDVTDDGPAETAGIQRWDVILGVNGIAVDDATDLTRAVGRLIAGSTNEFRILRDGEPMTVSVTVGERPEDPYALAANQQRDRTEREGAEGPFGANLAPLDDEAREALGLDPDERGLIITGFERGSALREAGLRTGMAILEVNGTTVDSVAVFEQAIERARDAGRDKVLMAVRIGQVTNFVTFDIVEAEE